MKKSPFKLLRRISVFVMISLLFNDWLLGQSFSKKPPAAEWKKTTWREKNIINQGTLTQDNSNDEWWFGHQNLYDGNGNHTGYIAFGYIGDVLKSTDSNAETNARMVFNESFGLSQLDSPHNIYPGTGSLFFTDAPTLGGDCQSLFDDIGATSSTDPQPVEKKEGRTEFRGMVARLDLKGNMIWCRILNLSGDGIQNVRQVGNYIYAIGAHSGVKTMFINSATTRTFIPYNRTNSNPSDYFDKSVHAGIGSSPNLHMYVAKLDLDGGRIWEGLYGHESFASPATAWQTYSIGQDIILNSGDQKLYAVGRTPNNSASPVTQNLFVVKIEPSNGDLLAESLLPMPTEQNSHSTNSHHVEGRSIVQTIASGTSMAIGSFAYYSGTDDIRRGIVYSITQNLTLNSGTGNWTTQIQPGVNVLPAGTINTKNSNLWNIAFNPVNDQIIVGLMTNCIACDGAHNQYGEGKIYRLSAKTGTLSPGTNPSDLGSINAFDLRIGVTATSDGGFAAVSSRRNGAPSIPSISAFGTFSSCTSYSGTAFNTQTSDQNNPFGPWDTDPVVRKYDSNGDAEWEWSEDVVVGRPRELPPGDFKRQECMYQISEADDGGLVISGNNSFNYDDNYMVKLYPDCNANISYDITGTGTANINFLSGSMGNQKVNAKVVVSGNLKIAAGVTVQMADELQTGKPCGFVILSGGKLEIESGAVVTSIDNNTCPGSMWSGISVVGTSSASQGALYDYTTVSTQGILTISSSTISNARTAITTGTQFPNHNFDWSSTGGIIKAENAVFLNNHRDVQYLLYSSPTSPNANKGLFHRCKFLTTAKLNDGTVPVGRFSMYDVKGVKIRGCEFEYLAGNAYASNERGYGILSCDASYQIEDACITSNCSSMAQSKFTGLSRGISALNTNPTRVVHVDHAILSNNTECGILFSNTHGGNITRNHIGVGDASATGIYLVESKFYAVNNNTVIGTAGFAPIGHGIITDNSRGGQHKMYRNQLGSLFYGITPVNENSSHLTNKLNIDDGLIMNCDVFDDNTYDIHMFGFSSSAVVAEKQGSLNKQTANASDPSKFVRNWYTAPCGTNQWEISGSTKNIKHPSFQDIETQPCGSGLVSISVASLQPFVFSTYCPLIDGLLPISNCPCVKCCMNTELANTYSVQKRIADSLTTVHNARIDGGNTTSLLDLIAETESTELLAELLSISPYLSDTVLKHVVYNNLLSPDDIVNLHDANKPVTSNVWTLIESMAYSSEINEELALQQDQYSVSVRQVLEDELARAQRELAFTAASKVSYFLTDTLENAIDSAIHYLSEPHVKLNYAPVMRASAYLNSANYDRAFEYADSLASIDEFEEIMVLQKALMELDTTANKLFSLHNRIDLLEVIDAFAADSTKPGSYWARTARTLVFNKSFNLIKLPEYTSGLRQSHSSNNTEQPNPVNSHQLAGGLTLFPNPAQSAFFINFTDKEIKPMRIHIYDMAGRELHNSALTTNVNYEIQTPMLDGGIYFISLVFNDGRTVNKKIVISK